MTKNSEKNSIKERIKAVRAALKLSQRDFAKGIYISQSLCAAIELDERKINNRHIQLIANKYNVNKDWILTGKGEMFSASPPDVKLEQLTTIFNELNGLFQDYLLLQSKELLRMQKLNE
jgi:transcriptional regulator with XRE-family HTH domain